MKKAKQQGPRRPSTGRAGGKQHAQAPLFDQQAAPLPKPEQGASDGMQQMVLPLGAVGMEPLDPPAAPKRRGRRKGKKPATEESRRRQISRGEMRRRRRRRRWFAVFFVLFLMTMGALLSVTVLFKVKHIVVENLDRSTPANTGIYTEDAILGALAIPMGENLFGFTASERQSAMEQQLPYLETILVRRRLPDTVVVQVAPAAESWCTQTDAGWLVLSAGLKVLDIRPEQPEDLPMITGLGIRSPAVGRRLELTTAQQTEQIADLMEQLDAAGLTGHCTRIDMGLGTDAYFVYDGRVKVLLGTFNNLDYKIGVAKLLIENESGEYLGSTDRGTLDVSAQLEDAVRRFTFAPGAFEQEASEPPVPDDAASSGGASAPASDSVPASGADSDSAPASDATSGSAPASEPASSAPAQSEPPAARQ